MAGVESIGGLLVGFGLTRFLSHPNYPVINNVPKINFKAIEILPNLRIKLKKYIFHIHHWMYLSLIFTILVITTPSFSQLLLFKTICIGGIIQGFTYKDRFQILVKNKPQS